MVKNLPAMQQSQVQSLGQKDSLEKEWLPTSSLTKDVAALIKSLSKKGMSMLIITHDMEFAKLVSNKIVSMDSGVIIDKHIYNDKTEISENAIQYN